MDRETWLLVQAVDAILSGKRVVFVSRTAEDAQKLMERTRRLLPE